MTKHKAALRLASFAFEQCIDLVDRRLLADRAHARNPADLFGGWLRFKLHRSPLPHDANSADLFGGIRSAELKVEVISPASSLKPNHPLDKPAGFSDSRDAIDIFDRLIQSYQQTQLE